MYSQNFFDPMDMVKLNKRKYDQMAMGCHNDKKEPNKKKPKVIRANKPNDSIQPKPPIDPLLLFFLTNNQSEESNSKADREKPNPPVEELEICPGKQCDHDPKSSCIPSFSARLLNRPHDYKITLKDLIDLGMCYHCQCQKYFYSISLERLARLVDPLEKLYRTIGMKIIKDSFTEQIVYFLLDVEPNPAELLHTILEGPPGVGKTMIIDILAEIYLKMGYLTKKIIKKVKISDLKGKYVGHTAYLTQNAIDEAEGGVLVIDEAYSFGNAEKLDSFSKEIIDTLNRNLTEKAGKFVCIIAGYGDHLDKCLFAHNPGLASRFRFHFVIETYNSEELMEIFKIKVFNDQWSFDNNLNRTELSKFFFEKYQTFKYYGRDMETLLFHTKVAHCNRAFFEPKESFRKITMADIYAGYNRFLMHQKSDNKIPISVRHIYL